MEHGLSTAQAKELREKHGPNSIHTAQKFSPIALFLGQFPSFINGLMAIASIFSFLLGDYLDSIFILSIIILDSVFGFIQEYKAEKSLGEEAQ